MVRIHGFKVSARPVSFHHPLHWLLGSLLMNVPASIQTTKPLDFWQSFLGDTRDPELQKSLLSIFEYPVRVQALLAHIRAGLWVT